ncbi:YfiR family protein [Rheinheimera gaetbuli]
MKVLHIVIFITLLTATFSFAALAAEQKSVKNQKDYALLQAAYLFNIAKFISWPAQHQQQPLKICLLGDAAAELQVHFSDAFKQRTLGERKVETFAVTTKTELSTCNLIYLTSDSVAELPPTKDYSNILAVSSPEVTAVKSALFDLRLESGRIFIYYNKAAQTRFQLPINTALLRITKPTGEEP